MKKYGELQPDKVDERLQEEPVKVVKLPPLPGPTHPLPPDKMPY